MPNNIKAVSIDTVVLAVDIGQTLKLSDFKSYHQYKQTVANTDNEGPKYMLNILLDWPADMRQYYVPKVWYSNYPKPYGGGRYSQYQIELSLPKFIFGNNIAELREQDFDTVVDNLYLTLKRLDLPVPISKAQIIGAKVVRVDYGKNIIFSDGTSMSALNNLLARAPMRKGSTYGKTQYNKTKQGELFRKTIKDRAFVIYDKKAEYEATRRQARPPYISNMAMGDIVIPKSISLIRLELQIQKTQKLKTELKSLKLDNHDVSFRRIFSADLSRALLERHWHNILNAIKKAGGYRAGDYPTFLMRTFIVASNSKPRGRIGTVFGRVGLTAFVETCGASDVKNAYEANIGDKHWTDTYKRLMLDLDTENPIFLDKITESVTSMTPLDLEELTNEY